MATGLLTLRLCQHASLATCCRQLFAFAAFFMLAAPVVTLTDREAIFGWWIEAACSLRRGKGLKATAFPPKGCRLKIFAVHAAAETVEKSVKLVVLANLVFDPIRCSIAKSRIIRHFIALLWLIFKTSQIHRGVRNAFTEQKCFTRVVICEVVKLYILGGDFSLFFYLNRPCQNFPKTSQDFTNRRITSQCFHESPQNLPYEVLRVL